MTLAIDAHQHFWRIDAPRHQWPRADLPAVHRDFLPGDLTPAPQRCDNAGTVLVQSQRLARAAAGYSQGHETARAMVPEAQCDAAFVGNAGRIYRLLAGN